MLRLSRYLLPFILLCSSAFSETVLPLGNPIVRTHSPREYHAHVENFSIARNSKGVLFAGNGKGLLEYDGIHWRTISPELFSQVFSVAVDSNDRVFLGTFDTFGYLDAQSDGSYVFTSLLEYVPDEHRGDQLYRKISIVEEVVYFSTSKRLYIWDIVNETMSVVGGLDNSSDVFVLKGNVYSTSSDVCLRILQDGKWNPVLGAEAFEGINSRFQKIGVGAGGVAYLVSPMNGIIAFDGEQFESFSRDSSYVAEWRDVESVLVLKSGFVVVGTRRYGVYLFGPDGALVQHVDQDSGLSDDWAGSLIADEQGGVWMVQNKGLTRVQLAYPISLYDNSHGLEGAVHFIERYEGDLFVGTSVGLYRAGISEEHTQFELLEGVPESKALLPTKHGLLVGTIEGLYLYRDGVISLQFEGLDSSYLYRLQSRPDLIASAGYPGMTFLQETGSGLKILEGGPVTFEPVHGIAEAANGDLWLKSGNGVTRRVRFAGGDIQLQTYTVEDGLSASWVSPLSIEGEIVFTSSRGALYSFDEAESRFSEGSEYHYFPQKGVPGFLEYVRDPNGKDWVSRSSGVGNLIEKPAGDYIIGMQYLSEMIDVKASAALVEENGTVWLGTYDGLTRYDPGFLNESFEGFDTVIRSIESLDNGKIVYFDVGSKEVQFLKLEPGQNSIRIRLSTTWSVDPDSVLYRIELVGFDKELPDFVASPMREIVNLPVGDYVLKVHSLDSLGRLGTFRQLPIEITAPLYRTLPAYVVYVLLFSLLVYLFFNYRMRSLNQSNQQLRDLVAMRTAELEETSVALKAKNVLLESSNVELKQLAVSASEGARAKSRFLAIVSHEIRTPMNGVMGMCTLLERTGLTSEQHEFLTCIKSSNDSLLNVIDDILDYSKNEEGRLGLESISFDVVSTLESVLSLLGPQANERGLEIHVVIDPRVKRMRIGDPTRIRQVLVNLVGNALKFTKKGSITISLHPEEGISSERLAIEVVDTGVGVDESKIKTLFDPFFQADISNARKFGGTGLGLSICKQIVTEMNGEISVESKIGEGARFIVSVPLELCNSEIPLWDSTAVFGKSVVLCCGAGGIRNTLEHYLIEWGIRIENVDMADFFLNPGSLVADCDLVIMEHNLVSFDGLELAKRALDEIGNLATPVLLLVSEKSDRLRAEIESIDRLSALVKPVLPSRLLQLLSDVLTSSSASDMCLGVANHPATSGVGVFSDLSVLVVEDDSLNRNVAVKLLQDLQVNVTAVENGSEAVAAYSVAEYDLVLMDLKMPVMGGAEATRRIFEEHVKGESPFVYGLSGGVLEEEQRNCSDAGMVGFIRKPFEMVDLIAALNAARGRLAVSG